jgi:hypothetical protein
MTSQNLTDLAISEITSILQRANEAAHGVRFAPTINETKLRIEVEDLLSAVGIANDGRENAILFANPPVPDATHEQLARQLRAVAASDDPLDRRISYGIALAELSNKLLGKWASRHHHRRLNRPHTLPGITFDVLTEAERADVREAALELVAFHEAQIRRGSPTKTAQDTLLDGLADIYLSHTGSSQHRYELPHSVRSHFIQFCHAVLRPFFPLTEVSPKALSNCWIKLKRRHFTPRLNPQFATLVDEAYAFATYLDRIFSAIPDPIDFRDPSLTFALGHRQRAATSPIPGAFSRAGRTMLPCWRRIRIRLNRRRCPMLPMHWAPAPPPCSLWCAS